MFDLIAGIALADSLGEIFPGYWFVGFEFDILHVVDDFAGYIHYCGQPVVMS